MRELGAASSAVESRNPRFIAVDFYSGAGGTTYGLIAAGGYVICGIDRDTACRTTYLSNNRNRTGDRSGPGFLNFDMLPVANHPGGQQHLVMDALLERVPQSRARYPAAPLLFAICAPCQSFTGFVQRNMTESRTEARDRDRSLLEQTVPFIEEFHPELVLCENVAGMSRGKHTSIWSDFVIRLQELRYAVGESVVCASRFGVPQRRKRSILLAIRQATRAVTVPLCNRRAKTKTVRDAIGRFPPIQAGVTHPRVPNHESRNLTPRSKLRLRSLPPGASNVGLRDTEHGDLSLACHARLESKESGGFRDVYTRMKPTGLAPTITTRFISVSNGRFGHYDDEQIRGLSLREGAALQTFPDKYRFFGSGSDQVARMIGNAVPPRLARFFASWLVKRWNEEFMRTRRQRLPKREPRDR